MKLLRYSLALAALFVLAAWAQPAHAQKGGDQIHGVITSINKEGKTIEMMAGKKKKGGKVTLKFDNITKFSKTDEDGNTEKAKLEDLAPGKSVDVVLDKEDTAFASKVTIVPEEMKKKKKNN